MKTRKWRKVATRREMTLVKVIDRVLLKHTPDLIASLANNVLLRRLRQGDGE